VATDYTVTTQQQTSRIAPTGGLEDVMLIGFTTIPEGVNGTVEIALQDYSAAAVAALIEPQVATIKAVQAL